MELTSEFLMLTYDEVFLERYIATLRHVAIGGYTKIKEEYDDSKNSGNKYVIEYESETDDLND